MQNLTCSNWPAACVLAGAFSYKMEQYNGLFKPATTGRASQAKPADTGPKFRRKTQTKLGPPV